MEVGQNNRTVWCGLSLIGKAPECELGALFDMGLGALGVSNPIGHPKRFCENFILAKHGRSMRPAVNREIKVRVLTPEPFFNVSSKPKRGKEDV